MGSETVPHPLYCPDLAPCDFWLFPKFRGCRYGTTEEMKEAVTKVLNTLTQEDVHGAFQNLLERYKKTIAAGRDYFEGDKSFMCVLSIKVPIRKKVGKPIKWSSYNIYIYIYIKEIYIKRERQRQRKTERQRKQCWWIFWCLRQIVTGHLNDWYNAFPYIHFSYVRFANIFLPSCVKGTILWHTRPMVTFIIHISRYYCRR